jgi:outer membrane protein assembly factor BamB
MKGYRLARFAMILLFSGAALTGFGNLVAHDPAAGITMSMPGTDGRPVSLAAAGKVSFGGRPQAFDGRPSTITASWPRFRGTSMDATSHEQVPLVNPGAGWKPAILWHVDDLGEGYAGPAVANGRVYVLDYDENRQADTLRCFSLDDGKEIWRNGYTVRMKRNHGFSRTIPAVNERYVVTIGPSCQVMCCNAVTGALLWGIDLVERYGTEVPGWYTGQCPFIDGSEAVVAVGGSALLVGIDLETGHVRWETPNPDKLAMSHSSIMVMTIGGVRQYVYAAIGGIIGVSAEPSTRGSLLWESTAFDATVIAPSPVYVGKGRVFLTAGYGAGSILLEVTRSGAAFSTRVLYRKRPADGFACEQQTPVVFKGMLLGILPMDAGAKRAELACWDPEGRWA